MDCSDEAVFARVQADDRSAFGLLVQRYQDRVYSVALNILHQTQDAEDATQQAFLHLWHKRHAYNVRWRFRPWLYRMVTNICIDEYRRQQRRPTVSEAHLQTVASAHSPAQDVEHYERCQALSAALEHVPPEARLVLVLYYMEGLSYREIATIRGIAVETVKSRLRRAKAQLRQRLTPYHEDTV